MDGEEPNSVRTLLFGDRLELSRPERLLLGDEANEALDVGAAQLLVRTCETGELAHVGVATASIPLGERGEVVVMLGDDRLEQALEGERGCQTSQALVALVKGAAELLVAGEELRQTLLERLEERALRRGTPQEDERVVGNADERG